VVGCNWSIKPSATSNSSTVSTLNIFHQILDLAGLWHDANSVCKIKRLGLRSKPLELPTREQFDRLVEAIATSGADQSKRLRTLNSIIKGSGLDAEAFR
jgi:hypothetical protein